uniref:DUF3575 domain-containing protein n=1 Tax=Fervidobacterium thailandense TaxID=1008305 RepID=A0A7C4CDB8_9BACT
MNKRFVLILLILLITLQVLYAQQPSAGLHVVLSVQHFAGLEVRTTVGASEVFLTAGMNGISAGIRFSSTRIAGLYISPNLLIDYSQKVSFGFLVGWRTKLKELAGAEFFLQGGVGGLLDNVKRVADFGVAWKF